jgi:hypothetical protein
LSGSRKMSDLRVTVPPELVLLPWRRCRQHRSRAPCLLHSDTALYYGTEIRT